MLEHSVFKSRRDYGQKILAILGRMSATPIVERRFTL